MNNEHAGNRKKTMSIGEFAKLAGVSQRTLRFYEEKGLLQPSSISESGRRYYELDDLIPLQQILTFKYLGFSLDEIRSMIAVNRGNLKQTLLLQKHAMEQKRNQIDRVIKAIDHAIELLQENEELDPQVFSFLIQSILSEHRQIEFLSEVFPEQTIRNLKSLFSDRDRELDWNKRSANLFQRIKRAIGQYPPESDEIQNLIHELMQMTKELLGDDWRMLQTVAEQLDGSELPDFFQSPFSSEEEEILTAAFHHYLTKKGWMENET